jgi:hypothetical protein
MMPSPPLLACLAMSAFLRGIEFEYLLIDTEGDASRRIRDFSNLDLPDIAGGLRNDSRF